MISPTFWFVPGRTVLRMATLPGNPVYVIEIQVSVFAAGRTDTDEGDICILHGISVIRCRLQHSAFMCFLDQFVNVRLNNGGLARVDEIDLSLCVVYADHMMPELCQTCGTDTAYISQTENADIHS